MGKMVHIYGYNGASIINDAYLYIKPNIDKQMPKKKSKDE